MDLDDEVVESRSRDVRSSSFRVSPLTIYLGLIGLLVVGAAISQVGDKLIYLGYFVLALIGIVGIMGVVALYYRLLRQRKPAKAIPIAATGVIWHDEVTGKITIVAPQAAIAPKKEPALKSASAKRVVPTMTEILANGNVLFPGMAQILMGFQESMTPRWGTMDGEIKSVGIGGRGRSGKTVTMLFYIIQHLLQFTEVWIADPHYNKPSGLTNVLGPLRQWVRVATTSEEIRQMSADLEEEVRIRKNAPVGTQFRRLVAVYDEWNGILEAFDIEADEADEDSYTKTVAALIAKIEREMAGYEMYVLLGVHSWTDKDIGGTTLRRLIHSVLCHRMPADYSRHILPKKQADQTESLRTGHAIFRDNEGYCEKLMIPYCTTDDAITVAGLLEAVISGQQAEENALLSPPAPAVLLPPPPRQLGPGKPKQTEQPAARQRDTFYSAETIELGSQRRETGPLLQGAINNMHVPAEEIDEEPEELPRTEEELMILGTQQVHYSATEEIEFLKAVNQIRVEKPGEKINRVAILARIRATVEAEQGLEAAKKWNRKKWVVISALSDKYGL